MVPSLVLKLFRLIVVHNQASKRAGVIIAINDHARLRDTWFGIISEDVTPEHEALLVVCIIKRSASNTPVVDE